MGFGFAFAYPHSRHRTAMDVGAKPIPLVHTPTALGVLRGGRDRNLFPDRACGNRRRTCVQSIRADGSTQTLPFPAHLLDVHDHGDQKIWFDFRSV